jgi:predicted ATPase
VPWGYDLLGDDECALLRRLSVFPGFTAEAAQAVGAFRCVDHDAVFDLLGHLVDKSLVQVDDVADNRYRLLETVRDFCRARLIEHGESDAARDARPSSLTLRSLPPGRRSRRRIPRC